MVKHVIKVVLMYRKKICLYVDTHSSDQGESWLLVGRGPLLESRVLLDCWDLYLGMAFF